MRAILVLLAMCLISSHAPADMADCQNLYVGRIWVESGGGGLYGAVFLNDPSNSSGSYWVIFNGWNADEKKAALALLTAAKISQHRVNVATFEANGCRIQESQTIAKSVFLANNP